MTEKSKEINLDANNPEIEQTLSAIMNALNAFDLEAIIILRDNDGNVQVTARTHCKTCRIELVRDLLVSFESEAAEAAEADPSTPLVPMRRH